jgi:hypothetical protein
MLEEEIQIEDQAEGLVKEARDEEEEQQQEYVPYQLMLQSLQVCLGMLLSSQCLAVPQTRVSYSSLYYVCVTHKCNICSVLLSFAQH